MRLLYTASDGRLNWTDDLVDGQIPPYAILSHTWDGQEVAFKDLKDYTNIEDVNAKLKGGYQKIFFCAQQAKRDGLDYFWVDTCCIDKSSSAELQEAINSMFGWYQNAKKCYVYLSDVECNNLDADSKLSQRWQPAFRRSKWFTRGWTLQELLAPASVSFYSREGELLGDKQSLRDTIYKTTRIPVDALLGKQVSEFSVAERLSWADHRQTTCPEDSAYCLLGIFDIHLPLIYGEGKEKALKRLRKEIEEASKDTAGAFTNSTKVRSQRQEEKLDKICSWLSAPDPSTNYHKAHKQRQPETGLWLLDGAKLAEWKKSAASRLWLYGIPGCGKTILSSIIIEHLLQHCHDSNKTVTVYFYFDFNDTRKQDPELMLRSLLCQLLQRSATTLKGVDALFSACENGQKQPSLRVLLEVTLQVMQQFTHVYIVLDALDECTQRQELMSLLETVAGWQLDNVHLLMTSRKERDIESFLESYVKEEDTICLQRDVVDKDIQQYIQQRLSVDRNLARWNKDAAIRNEIEAALMHGARGMFRWAVCQLDTLAMCYNRAMLRKSLATLPQTLDQTYDRILSGISEESSEYAARILQWLTFSARPLSVEEIAEVVAIDVARDPAFDRNEVLEDPLKALNICSSLVTVTTHKAEEGLRPAQRIISLSHYSVRDYLISDRIKQGQAKQYSMQEAECHNKIAEGSLKYLMQLQQPLSKEVLEASALARYASEFWSSHLRKAGNETDGVSRVAISLMSMENPAYLTWIQLFDPDNLWKRQQKQRHISRTPTPLYYAAILGLNKVVELLLEAGADPNAQGGYHGNALQAASYIGNGPIVKLLLSKGAGANMQGGQYDNALQVALENGYKHIAKILLEITQANAGSRIASTDSGYASQRQGDNLGSLLKQDPGFEQNFHLEEEASIQVPTPCDVEAHLDDIRSIESDHESIGSKISTSRSKAELYAIKYLASFFAQLKDLRSLHEAALQKIERRRFTENYRRILKSYYRRLLCEAANDTEKEVTRIFRSRQNRESIAEGIAAHVEHVEEEESRPLDNLMAQPAVEEYLEDWLRATGDVDFGRPREADQESVVDNHHSESSDTDSGLDTDSDADYHDLLNINHAKKFLQQGSAFRNLVLDIQLLMLPGHLREIVETTPKSLLHILSNNDTSWVNRTKASLETYTELVWDWWPLAPRVPSLGVEEHHLRWKLGGRTLYVKISQRQADALREVLKWTGDHPSKCYCCVVKPRKAFGVTFGGILGSVSGLLNRQRSAVAGGTSSRAAKAYTPAPDGTSKASSSTQLPTTGGASAHSVALNKNGTKNTIHTQACSSTDPSPTVQIVPTRIIFGIQGVRRSLEIEQIEVSGQMNDQIFFSELKTRYKKHCSSFRRFLSPFRFRYCSFVKFQKLNVNRVFSFGEGLPDPEVFADDYDYDPKYPEARIPPIDPELFAVCLESCDEDCVWSIFGSRLHDCFHLPPLGDRLKLIPKKKSEFAVQSGQDIGGFAWGIEADYALSLLHLSVYHLIPLLSGFGFWVYWLTRHPGDWQNASVPTLTTIALMAVFWVPFGSGFNSRLGVGRR